MSINLYNKCHFCMISIVLITFIMEIDKSAYFLSELKLRLYNPSVTGLSPFLLVSHCINNTMFHVFHVAYVYNISMCIDLDHGP